MDSLPPLPPACLFSRPYLPHHRSCIHRILSPTLPCPRRVFTCCRTATLAADTAHSNTKPSPSYVMQVCGVSHTAVPSEVAGVQGGMQDARFRACFSLLNSGLASWHFPTLPPLHTYTAWCPLPAGALFVAAAGNEYTCNDDVPTYPASYDLANVVAGQRAGPRAAVCWFTAWLALLQTGLPACSQAAPTAMRKLEPACRRVV